MPVDLHGLSKFKQKLFLTAFERTKYGELTLIDPQGNSQVFKGSETGMQAEFHLLDVKCLNQIASSGDIGLGETYMKGMWTTSNLPNLLTFFVQNVKAIENLIHGQKFIQFALSLGKFFTRNTVSGSKENIFKHYDLGNDFYELWLDETMTYSSAVYGGGDKDLVKAQYDKYDRILNSLNTDGDSVLEIGCGWGGFSERAGKSGLNVDAITISKAQAEFANNRMVQKGISRNVSVNIQDYREVTKQYNSIVSIEMFEAVGYQFWDNYFATLKNSLVEKGKAVIQTITIDETLFEGYKNRTDFIQKHVFPGGMLPTKTIFNEFSTKFGFTVNDSFSFGQCYAKTLSEWLKNFDTVSEKIKGMGFCDEFIRKWRFYLAYCIAGFATQQTDVVQFTLESNAR